MDGYRNAILQFQQQKIGASKDMTRFLRLHFSALASALALHLFFALGSAWAGTSPKAGTQAPAFSLPALFKNQGEISLRPYIGKVVLVDFWASWCPPCIKTLPELGQLYTRNPGLVVLALSIDEDPRKALDFIKGRDTSLVYLHDANREVAEKFDLGGMPSAYLIDKKGMLRNRFDGYGPGELKSMETEVKKLLGEKP